MTEQSNAVPSTARQAVERWLATGGEMRILGSGDPVEVALLSCDGGQEMDRVRLSAAEAATIANR
ncbi:MAG: hypothetical protein KBG85_05180 [Micropruina sp.]|nr:hypothetical protein [Micropruina sp.]